MRLMSTGMLKMVDASQNQEAYQLQARRASEWFAVPNLPTFKHDILLQARRSEQLN